MEKFIFSRLYNDFINDICSYRAAALTFSTLLSLVPLISICFAILSFFPQFQLVNSKVEDFIFAHLVTTSGVTVQRYIDEFAKQATNLSIISFIFLLVTSIHMMFTIEQSLNAIWGVRKHRHFFKALLLYLTILIIAPIFLGLSFLISAQLESLVFVNSLITTLKMTQPLLFIFPIALSIAMLTFLYFVLPHRTVKLLYCFVGASVAAILFELAKEAFALYFSYFSTYHVIYGALSAIPIFLLWVYFCWIIFLLGALITRELHKE